MITKDNLKALLIALSFEHEDQIYSKTFADSEISLKVDFDKNLLIYPEELGLTIHERQTCNFSANENFVVFECVHRLLEKGYKPEHIELEPKWKVGHGASGGRADILVKNFKTQALLIIECKTFGKEFDKAWEDTQLDGGQLFSYLQQQSSTRFLCLYASDFKDDLVIHKNNIITTTDIKNKVEQYADKDIKPLFYQVATDVKQRYKVWAETYNFDYQTTGIFDPDNEAYNIGALKWTLTTLNVISRYEIQKKYNDFAEVLRKYNVSGKENAFDKLINLFLAKIVDETIHEYDLQFHWKGEYFDDYFALQDRLQALYKIGMETYLGEDITYINETMIDDAFWAVKQRPNATKDQIKKYFKQLKFYSNNDFGFIDVHNDKLFYQNAVILLDMIRLWEKIRLTGDQQHQFLGDMFEFFLDKGIKQSEGQFFTPMPICKFMLMSLPLEAIIRDSETIPKAIDYACGAGHFLTELASQIQPMVAQHKTTVDIKEYYKAIYGVEKEYRLSKVAKLSAFMYGQNEINIIYCDALNAIEQKIKDNIITVAEKSCQILVANPPFAVEGFLSTLPEDERKKYALSKTVTDISNNRNIQCFFIERAQQLLAANGVAAIIVPSSVLSNSDATHIGSREILLKYFDIVALVELGSGTFGKTGTNTVALFIRRKPQQPEASEQYYNRVENWFNGWEEELNSDGGAYQDLSFIKNYCQHIDIGFEHYQTLLQGNPSAELLACELFQDYKKDFDQSSDIKKLATQKFFKTYSAEQKQTELNKRYLAYLQKIEKDKLFYFVLAYSNPQKVLIVKSPSDNKEQKQFLGYEWSAAKGNEGLKMTTNALGHHLTPLYDPENRYNPDKLNALIQDNFSGNAVVIPEALETYASLISLVDLLDFSRKDFDKHISFALKNTVSIDEWSDKYELRKLSEVTLINPSKSEIKNIDENTLISFVEMASVSDKGFIENREDKLLSSLKKGSYTYFRENDIIIAKITPCMENGKCAFATDLTNGLAMGSSEFHVIRVNEEVILSKYIFALLNRESVRKEAEKNMTGSSGHRRVPATFYENYKIPLLPLEIQTEIVEACEAIDAEVMRAQCDIENTAKELERIKTDIFSRGFIEKKLSECSLINPSKTEIKQVDENTLISFVEMASVNEAGFINRKEDRLLKDLKKGSYTYFKENDIIIAKITPCMENGKCAFATDLTNGLAMGSSEFHVIRANEAVILGKYIFALLNRVSVRKEAEKNMTGSSGHRRVPASFYADYRIPTPDIVTQQQLITEIAAQETLITTAQQIIDAAASKKQAILKQYL